MDPDLALSRAIEALAAAERVTILTGAGVSAASGIPTFRGAGGLWRSFRAGDLATPEAFARDPALVWEWYDWRRGLIAAATPNAAHAVLAAWTRRFRACTLVTQNVDGLHERAGSADVVRLHGSIWELRCWARCRGGAPWPDLRVPIDPLPPRCPSCGALARPGVVWFGESLPEEPWARAVEAAAACDVFITAGTSALVQPAASLISAAAEAGATVIEINPDETAASATVDVAVRGAADVVLPRLDAALGSADRP